MVVPGVSSGEPGKTQDEHGCENDVKQHESGYGVNFADGLVHQTSEHLWEPPMYCGPTSPISQKAHTPTHDQTHPSNGHTDEQTPE